MVFMYVFRSAESESEVYLGPLTLQNLSKLRKTEKNYKNLGCLMNLIKYCTFYILTSTIFLKILSEEQRRTISSRHK